MSKPVTGLTTFAGTAPPWNLSSLDADIAALQTAVNDFNTYSNPLTDTSGAANTITVATPANVTASYTTGLLIYVRVANTTTSTAVVLNLNGLGNLNVKLPTGQLPPIGLIVANGVYSFYYDGTNLQLVAMSPIISNSAGNITIAAPATGNAISVTGAAATQLNAFSFTQSGQTGWSIYQPASSSDFRLSDGSDRLLVTSAGNVTINAPSSGVGLSVTGTNSAGGYGQQIFGSGTAGSSNGVQIAAGSNASDDAVLVQNRAQTLNMFVVRGDGVVFGNDGTNIFELGYKDMPRNAQNANYTLALADRGKFILCGAGLSTLTIPANASIAFSIGSTIVVVNNTGGSISIAITSDTLNWFQGGSNSTGTRTVAVSSVVTLLKVDTTSWVITGQGIS